MESLKSEMNLKTFHHEGHEDHEDSPCVCLMLGDHPQEKFNFFHNQIFFFVAFVFFVVQLGFAK